MVALRTGYISHIIEPLWFVFIPFGYIIVVKWKSLRRLASMTFINSVAGGFGVAAAVVTVLAISAGLSTWVFDGQTISSKVKGRIGGGN